MTYLINSIFSNFYYFRQEGNDKESQRFLSSTALRKSALIRATQRTSFDSILTEQDKPPPLHILEDQEI